MSFATLERMLDQSKQYDQDKQDIVAGARELQFVGGCLQYPTPKSQPQPLTVASFAAVEQNNLIFNTPPEIATHKPTNGVTDLAFSQWRSRMGPMLLGDKGTLARKDWEALRRERPEEFATIANWLHHRYSTRRGARGIQLRLYKHEVRAFLTDRYAALDNTQLLESLVAIRDYDDSFNPRIVRSSVTPDELYVKVLIPTPDDDGQYAIGVYIANGECGDRSVKIAPFVQRNSCDNSTIVQHDQAIRFAHTINNRANLANLRVNMFNLLPMAGEARDQMLEAELIALPKFSDIIAGMSKSQKWDDKFTKQVYMGSENDHTKAGLINGVSYAAQHAYEGQSQRIEEMEFFAGTLLKANAQQLERYA